MKCTQKANKIILHCFCYLSCTNDKLLKFAYFILCLLIIHNFYLFIFFFSMMLCFQILLDVPKGMSPVLYKTLTLFGRMTRNIQKETSPILFYGQYSVKLPLTFCNSTLVFNQKVIAALLSPSDNILWPPMWPASFTSFTTPL